MATPTANARRGLRKTEQKLTDLVSRYRDHGCSEAEIEQMDSVIEVRREIEFQRNRIAATT